MILSGWKQIAKHLDCGVRTVQRWERDGLPVMRPRGSRTHVMADSELLMHWVRNRNVRVDAAKFPPSLLSNLENAQRLRFEVQEARASLQLQMETLKKELASLRKKRRCPQIRSVG